MLLTPVNPETGGHGAGANLEEIEAELRWVSLRLRIIVERSRRRRSVGPPAEYRGLYVTDEEVDAALAGDVSGSAVGALVQEAAGLRAQLDERRADTGAEATMLERVVQRFGLSDAERFVLLVALAPYLDQAFEKVYAYANDDITRRWPTVGLVCEVISDDPAERLALRPLFYRNAPLLRYHLIGVGEGATATQSLLSRQVSPDAHIAEVLLRYAGLDPRLHGFARAARRHRRQKHRRRAGRWRRR